MARRIEPILCVTQCFVWACALWAILAVGCGQRAPDSVPAPPVTTPAETIRPDADGAFHVHPGMDIQPALDAAARDGEHKLVKVHAGTYRPSAPAFALLVFNAQHDGITLEAVGEVALTAANPDLADRVAASYPAIVNHVIYFGDRISSQTVVKGFTITGANGYLCPQELASRVEPNAIHVKLLDRGRFFYSDGGGIKIYGRSYPQIVGVKFVDNFASPCAGGVSVEHRGLMEGAVAFRNCVFQNNRCNITGSAIDLLPGSAATIENCLFVGNIANLGVDDVSQPGHEVNKEHGSGALTVFEDSKAQVRRCTFTGNWNGVDDKGQGNVYELNVFWNNVATGGISPGGRYEMDILDASQVKNCKFNGEIQDCRGSIDRAANVFDAPDPQFDAAYVPQNQDYAGAGYRPE